MIIKTLVENAGLKAIEIISFLYAEHASGNTIVDIHLEGGVCRDVCTLLIWDPHITKFFALKNAADAACTVLRVDQVISCHLSVFAKSHHWQTSIHKFCPYYFGMLCMLLPDVSDIRVVLREVQIGYLFWKIWILG